MAKFTIRFDATPETGNAPWTGRESARLKMMQSITDYLTRRCEASNVTIMEVTEQAEQAVPVKKGKKKSA